MQLELVKRSRAALKENPETLNLVYTESGAGGAGCGFWQRREQTGTDCYLTYLCVCVCVKYYMYDDTIAEQT